MENNLPECQKCNTGVLVPLSDYGRYKAWVCTNPDCGFNIRIDNGEISFGKLIAQSQK
jgi:ssDNA-binding Zn-finger/Zn-ribbon topoisomerase 1